MRTRALVVAGLIGLCVGARTASAHCDTLAGPVVADAKAALEKGDVTPVLKWVPKGGEDEVRAAFKKALAVRTKGPEAQELADQFFFETLVRIHRAGEGEPFTGLKPADAVEPIIASADKALESGSIEGLAKHVTQAIEAGIRKRFEAAVEAKKHANESVEAGRAFVAAYVAYVHFIEGIHKAAAAVHAHGEAAPTPKEPVPPHQPREPKIKVQHGEHHGE